MNKRLVLTFDAFGTLFTPREPVAKSYADTARRYGMSGFTDDQIASGFRNAFKQESRNAPNYGKKVGMDATQWWSNVINLTFQPFTVSNMLPEPLIPDLLNRFSSSEGYRLYPDVPPIFRSLREWKQSARERSNEVVVNVGVVTNSDDRVPSILSSLGMRVCSLRHGTKLDGVDHVPRGTELFDIDFVVLSFDVGYEKPSREIFDAAKGLGSFGQVQADQEKYIHVGDDLDKDFKGAVQAGWEGLFLDREGHHASGKPAIAETSMSSLLGLKRRIQQGRNT